MGLAADDQTLADASAARRRGHQAGAVDLADFVFNAIRLDGGNVNQAGDTQVFEITLPHDWIFGLDKLPGYDAEQRVVRLTTQLDLTRDAQGNAVGYLGRAHPLVRRALDRVRNLSFGGSALQGQDLRASVVRANVPAPTLLFTYLGRVQSRIGRELEQVLGVRCQMAEGKDDGFAFEVRGELTAEDWLQLADPNGAIRTTGVFEQHFKPWFAAAAAQARQQAQADFATLGAEFIASRRRELELERTRQDEWLRQRTSELLPRPATPAAQQLDLFAASATTAETAAEPAWSTHTEPVERLAAFATDAAQPPRARGEAEGVLRIYRQRLQDLDARLDLRAPEVVPLGVLMVVPE
jgi:hypothetical protein